MTICDNLKITQTINPVKCTQHHLTVQIQKHPLRNSWNRRSQYLLSCRCFSRWRSTVERLLVGLHLPRLLHGALCWLALGGHDAVDGGQTGDDRDHRPPLCDVDSWKNRLQTSWTKTTQAWKGENQNITIVFIWSIGRRFRDSFWCQKCSHHSKRSCFNCSKDL